MAFVRANVFAFKSNLEKFAESINKDVGLVRKKMAIDLFSLVQSPEKATSDGVMVPGVRHPVDTGRARFGWAMSDGTPSVYVPPAGEYDGKAPGNAHRTASFNKPFEVTWIVNNVPYMGRLEFDSHSPQAIGGWVRRAIALLELSLVARTQEPK